MAIVSSRSWAASALAVCLLLGGCGANEGGKADEDADRPDSTLPMQADWPGFKSLDQAADYAGLIVVGIPLETSESTLPDPSGQEVVELPLTMTELRVTEVIKGDASAGDRLRIGQTGTISHREASTTYLTEIDAPEVLLFLPGSANEYYSPINPEQGVYLVNEDIVTSLPGATTALPVKSLDRLSRSVARADRD